MSVLSHFIETQNNLEGFRELLRNKANPNRQDRVGHTPLHFAILKSERNPEETDNLLLVVRELIRFGANVDLSTNRGITPLHYAVSCRKCKMIAILLESGANVNAEDNEGYTPLHYATSKRKFFGLAYYDTVSSVVKLLLEKNPKLDVQGRNKETPLIFAVQANNIAVLRALFEKDVSARLQDIRGNCALHYALDHPELNEYVVLELMRHGGSFNTTNNRNVSAISLYFRKLMSASRAELEKSKYVFKLYAFYANGFSGRQRHLIYNISKIKKYPLYQFVKLCRQELYQMQQDELSENCTIRDIAVVGAYCRFLLGARHFPYDVCYKVLDKLLKDQYPIYCDFISAGICDPYLREEFCRVGSLVRTKGGFMKSLGLYLVSYHLSSIDILNFIKACTYGFRRNWYLPRFTYCTRCSVS